MFDSDLTFFRALQFLTVGFGCICAACPFLLFWRFSYSKRAIGKAVAFMLLGESIGVSITVVFAITSDGILDIGGPWQSMFLRWGIYGTAFVTSIHLAYRTWQVETGTDE
jgi:hypothetical protein